MLVRYNRHPYPHSRRLQVALAADIMLARKTEPSISTHGGFLRATPPNIIALPATSVGTIGVTAPLHHLVAARAWTCSRFLASP